jgi:hypothetical protein
MLKPVEMGCSRVYKFVYSCLNSTVHFTEGYANRAFPMPARQLTPLRHKPKSLLYFLRKIHE